MEMAVVDINTVFFYNPSAFEVEESVNIEIEQ
jgi:hypothetical protein